MDHINDSVAALGDGRVAIVTSRFADRMIEKSREVSNEFSPVR